MKYSFLFLWFFLIFMTINVHGQSKWTVVDSIGRDSGNLKCYDSLNCMYIYHLQGAGGFKIRRTTDGGNIWKTVYKDSAYIRMFSPDSFDIHLVPVVNDLAYPNEKLCIAVGDSGLVLRSTDKGETWESYRTDTNVRNSSISVFNENISSMVSFKNSEYIAYFSTTTDGGKTWEKMPYPKWPTSNRIFGAGKVQYFEPDLFVGHTMYKFSEKYYRNYLIYVHNNWESWDTVSAPSPMTYYSFGDKNNVWTAGSIKIIVDTNTGAYNWRQYIYHSSDGGLTWEKQWDSVLNKFPIRDIEFYDKDFGMASSERGQILITEDGGKTWISEYVTGEKPEGYPRIANNIQIVNRNTAYVVYGFHYIYKWTRTPPTGVEAEQRSKITISPNPATDYIEINLNNVIPAKAGIQDLSVKVYNVLGVEVLRQDSRFRGNDIGFRGNDTQVLRIDVSHLSPGVYFVRAGTKMYKFVKM